MKILKIAWKDFKITYRDMSALMLMIAAPIVMTLVMTFAFSGSSDSGFSIIPVALVNHDDGMFSEMLVSALESENVQEYLSIEKYETLEKAQKQLDQDKVGAVIVIPEDASAMMNMDASNQEAYTDLDELTAEIDLYTNPTRPISGMIVEAIMDSILTQVNAGFAGGLLGFGVLLDQNLVTADELYDGMGEKIGQELEPLFAENQAQIEVETSYWQEDTEEFDWMSYMAPSLAILFLGFSMISSARSILTERENGTFGRLLASPTDTSALIVGKMLGTFLIGLIQVLIFILVSIPLLGLSWGPPIALVLFTLALVLSSASWGIIVASLAKNSGQASALGMAINLVFAAVAGNFVPRMNYPIWLQKIGYLTPNAWGIEGYLKLINGGSFADVQTSILVLLLMSVILLTIASISFSLQYGQALKTGGSHE